MSAAIIETIEAQARTTPDRVALDALCGAPVRYGDLPARVRETMAALEAGCERGHPLAFEGDYGIETALLELAALAGEWAVLSLPGFFTAEQRRHAMTSCGARTVAFPDPRLTDGRRRSAPVPLPLGTARITFTSGSTGTPKGICLSAGHMLTVARSVVETLGHEHAGRHLALLPPGILLETVAGFLATILAGGTYLCPSQSAVGLADPFRPDFAAMLGAIVSSRATSLILVPEYLAGLVTAMERSGERLPLLTLVAVGGARVPLPLLERARAVGLPVRQGYGLTEFASVVSLERSAQDEPGSAGQVLPHVRATIAADGEILLDGPLCLGAIGGEAPTTPFATGDIGRIDASGRLWIEGRKSNLIITSFGRNISPEWVEAALLAQPEIAQAMVYGDGLPAPEALIVPASADADVAAAVAAANTSLPAYARVARWREAAHFTPFNGQLTGNGRLRRTEIAQAYLIGSPAFFTELEAATVRDRLRFMTVPQLQAGLSGTIDRRAYVDYLAQAWHHVRHTVPLLEAARASLAHRADLAAALDEYVEEETGHDEWILSDIAAAGGDAEAVRASDPAPATAAMVNHAYDRIAHGNAVSFFGMVYVLESVSVAMAQRGAAAVKERLGLPANAFTYLTSHGALDQEHMGFFARLVNGLTDPADRAAIVEMAQDMFRLYGAVFGSIALTEADRVAA